jgi:hypothetical protein
MKNSEAGKKGPVSMLTHCNTGYAIIFIAQILSADRLDLWPQPDTAQLSE